MKLLRKIPVLVMLLALILLQVTAFAVAAADMGTLNQELDEKQQQVMDKPNLAVEFVKLAAVLGLIVVAAWFVIKVFSRQVTSRMQGNWLRVVDEVVLGQNKGIILCEVGEKVFAVGVTDHNISILFEVNDPKLLAEISIEMADRRAYTPANSLRGLWDNANRRWGRIAPHSPAESGPTDFQTLMEEQVRRIQDISSTSLGGSQRNADKKSEV